MNEEVVVTGGSDGDENALKRVSLYGKDGWVRDMPRLRTGRQYHGCSSFSTGGEQVKTGIKMSPIIMYYIST